MIFGGVFILLLPRWFDEYKRERVDLLIRHAKGTGFDVLLLQEVSSLWYSAAIARYLIAEAAKVGFTHHYACPEAPSFPWATLGNSGLVVLSRHPVVRGAFVPFKAQSWFERHVVSRGALFVQISAPSGAFNGASNDTTDLFLFTTHLTSAPEVLFKGLNMSEAGAKMAVDRNSTGKDQMKEYLAFMRLQLAAHFNAAKKHLVVVAGDLNCKPTHDEYTWFADAVGAAAHPALPCGPLVDAWAGEWEPTFATIDTETGERTETRMTHAGECAR
jgi:endonuclease/exonuclease/phosphatase family metal-dependent hydrolase